MRYNGRGCAISQAAASMLSDAVKGRRSTRCRRIGKEDVLDELGIPLTPIRLKCALLSVGVLKVALAELKGESIPAEWASDDEITWKSRVGAGRRDPRGRGQDRPVRVAVRGRLPHRAASCTRSRIAAATTTARCARASERDSSVICPRHGARFDLRTGAVLSLPATEDVEAFPVVVRDGEVVRAGVTVRPALDCRTWRHLSEATQEYLESIYWLYEAGIERTQANLARALQVSQPSASEMLRRHVR